MVILSSSPAPVSQKVVHKNVLDAITWLSETDEEPSPVPKRRKYSLEIATQDRDSIVDSASTFLRREVSKNVAKDSFSDPISYTSSPLKSSYRPPEPTYTVKQLRDANKVTRKKADLLGEMVVEISNLVSSKFFENEDIETEFAELEVRAVSDTYPTIAWKRKVQASYDPQRDLFIPCELTEYRERILVVYYDAKEIVKHIQDRSLDTIIRRVIARAQTENSSVEFHVIILVDGYDQYLAKIRNEENKRYKARVLGQPSLGTLNHQLGEKELTVKDVESMVQETQIRLEVNIFPVRNGKEALTWLNSFTYTIAGRIYDKYERTSLGTLGTVRSGTGSRSTFVQSMRQFRLMTEPKAERLLEHYPSLSRICEQLNNHGTLGQDSNGKNIVPPSVNAAMKVLFTSNDPEEVVYEG